MTDCYHPTCQNTLDPSWVAGRPRRFCSNACRQAFYRWSKNGYEHVRVSRRYRPAPPVPPSPIKGDS
ncbi:MAG: hypothetical protein PHU14_07745 [Methylovulum sp.]|nr:hypothetical protein [Methylovulum sp.]